MVIFFFEGLFITMALSAIYKIEPIFTPLWCQLIQNLTCRPFCCCHWSCFKWRYEFRRKFVQLSIKSPTLFTPSSLCFHTPSPLSEWYPQSREILLYLSMKCWNSVYNAKGSRLIIVVVYIWAVKIYGSSSEGAEGKWKRGWNSVYQQTWWKN